MTSIAIFGSGSTLGQPIFDALSSAPFSEKVKYPIKVITRSTEGKTDTEKLKYVAATGVEAYTEAFRGVDVVVNIGGYGPFLDEVLEAVIAVKPKLYIPSQFGGYIPTLTILPGFLLDKEAHSKKARDAGIKVVDIYTSYFFGGPWLYKVAGHFGLDTEAKTATYFGNPDTPIVVSSLEDVGKVVALVSTSDPTSIPNEIKFYSDIVSQRIVAERYAETNNVEIKEIFVSDEDLKKQIKEKYLDNFSFANLYFYLQVAASEGEGHFTEFSADNSREFLNPGESVFKWSKF